MLDVVYDRQNRVLGTCTTKIWEWCYRLHHQGWSDPARLWWRAIQDDGTRAHEWLRAVINANDFKANYEALLHLVFHANVNSKQIVCCIASNFRWLVESESQGFLCDYHTLDRHWSVVIKEFFTHDPKCSIDDGTIVGRRVGITFF